MPEARDPRDVCANIIATGVCALAAVYFTVQMARMFWL
jgi:hypothetical protein